MNCKGAFPFRIGCTSYVLPDEILPNISFMADKVDDIELVLFESQEWSNLPDKTTFSSMQQIADEHDITYSVHFPIDCRAGAENAAERRKLLDQVTGIIRLTEKLPISGYLLHLEGLEDEHSTEQLQFWQEVTGEFCRQLVETVSVDPHLICIENLGYSPLLHQQLIEKHHFSHCIDMGHLWMNGMEWRSHVSQVLEKTRIIHLHGVSGGKDHQSLAMHAQPAQLQQLASMLQTYTGVVTLEVFGEEDTFSSLRCFGELWHRSR
ncbi:MAG: TIM barrel protein [Chitinispirillaceae bacterium]|nr:TIM barrel protein [Chitinispirillaceae bacterium]